MATVDVTVRGAGILGLAVAWTAARRGARVRVVDPHGVGAGSSGGVVGALAPHTPDGWNGKKQFQLDALRMADVFWAETGSVSGHSPGFARSGRLQPLADDAAVALARARGFDARLRWGPDFAWEVIPAADAGPWAPPSPSGLLVRDTLSARLHPRRAVAALAAALVASGGELVPDAPDEGAVVWATGWEGLLDLSRAVGHTVGGGVKGQAAVLRLALPADAPKLFVDGLHVVPHADGTVAVGSTSERDFRDPRATDAQLDALLARAAAALPVLGQAEVLERWAGVRPRARSRAPMLGAWPGRPGHFVANGGFKIGFGIAPMVGKVLTDLVLDGIDAIPDGLRVEDSL